MTRTLGETVQAQRIGELEASVVELESQKRALIATVADLQALVRLLSQNRLRIAG